MRGLEPGTQLILRRDGACGPTAQAREPNLAAKGTPRARGAWGGSGSGLGGVPQAGARLRGLSRPRKSVSHKAGNTRTGVRARSGRQPTREEGPGPPCPRPDGPYLAVHLALLPHVDMGELGGGCQRVDVADKGQPRRTRGEARGPPLLQQLADPQGEEQQQEREAQRPRARLCSAGPPHGQDVGPANSRPGTGSPLLRRTPLARHSEVPPRVQGQWLAERGPWALGSVASVLPG